jgi:hypothetical protein
MTTASKKDHRVAALCLVALAAALCGALIAGRSDSSAIAGAEPAFTVLAGGGATQDNPWAGMSFGVPDDGVRTTTVSGRQVWVGAGRADWVCVSAKSVFGPGRFGACAHEGAAVANGSFTVSHPAPGVVEREGLARGTAEVVGLLPDGVSKVRVQFANGETAVKPVESNLVAFSTTADPERYTYSDESGQEHQGDLRSTS